MFEYKQINPYETKQFLIGFYKEQYLLFSRIGIGGMTKNKVIVTEKLKRCTANRLDQLIKGKKTPENTCYPDKLMKIWGRHIGDVPVGEPGLISSNRSFIGHIASRFDIRDLDRKDELSIVRNVGCRYINEKHRRSIEHTRYIDKYTTAYNSEVMRAILSHEE